MRSLKSRAVEFSRQDLVSFCLARFNSVGVGPASVVTIVIVDVTALGPAHVDARITSTVTHRFHLEFDML